MLTTRNGGGARQPPRTHTCDAQTRAHTRKHECAHTLIHSHTHTLTHTHSLTLTPTHLRACRVSPDVTVPSVQVVDVMAAPGLVPVTVPAVVPALVPASLPIDTMLPGMYQAAVPAVPLQLLPAATLSAFPVGPRKHRLLRLHV